MAESSVRADSERRESGQRAMHRYFSRSLVFIGYGPPLGRGGPRENGSGTLIATPGGKIVVLSAKHILEDMPPDGFSLGGQVLVSGGVHEPFVRHWSCPDRKFEIDVALALLTDAAAESFRDAAVPLSMVARSDEDASCDSAYLCGFPFDYRVYEVDHQAKFVSQNVSVFTYLTKVEGLDEKLRYRVTWTEGIPHSVTENMSALGVEEGKTFKHKRPSGISGGPLWKFDRVPPDQIWSPSVASRLIGVASAWDQDSVSLCPSSLLWGDWFYDTVGEIDSR
jgi:hypothetical protein